MSRSLIAMTMGKAHNEEARRHARNPEGSGEFRPMLRCSSLMGNEHTSLLAPCLERNSPGSRPRSWRIVALTATLGACIALSGCQTIKGWFGKDDVEQQQTEEQAAAEEEAEDADATPPRVIEPNVARRKIKTPKIDNENWEVGLGAGFLSIEDFGTNPTYAGQITYHVTEDFFFRGDLGQSTAGRTSFETLAGDIELLTGDERRFTYYSLSLGYNFLPGEVFLGRDTAMNSSFYVLGGIGSVDFAGDQRLTLNFGAGFRVLPTDWLAIHIAVQDRVFDTDLLGETKVTNNIEMVLSTTVFF